MLSRTRKVSIFSAKCQVSVFVNYVLSETKKQLPTNMAYLFTFVLIELIEAVKTVLWVHTISKIHIVLNKGHFKGACDLSIDYANYNESQ